MANINLLPWREGLRRERNQSFFVLTGILGAAGFLLVFLVYLQVSAQFQDQLARNNYIKQEQKALELKITEIDDLKKERAELESQMNIIQDLQGNRSVVVRLFDEISKRTPDGIFLVKVDRNGDRFKIRGVTESNNRISNMMRSLEDSMWLENANLESVVSDEDKKTSTFDLVVNEKVQKKHEDSDGV